MKKAWILLMLLPTMLSAANDCKICHDKCEYCTPNPYETNPDLQDCLEGHPIDFPKLQVLPTSVYFDPTYKKFYITLCGEFLEIEIKECEFCEVVHESR